MIKVKTKHIVLYAVGIILLIFGQRSFWDGIQETTKQKEAGRKMAEESRKASSKAFEVQELVYDPAHNAWKNNNPYFQTLHVGSVNFKALKKGGNTSIETNDDENASDSF